MDITKMLVELREERERITEAIDVLQRIAHGRGKRRGRPPGSKNKPKNGDSGASDWPDVYLARCQYDNPHPL